LDDKELDVITKEGEEKDYLMKESNMLNYNERQVNYIYLTAIRDFISRVGGRELKKQEGEPVQLVVQLHRGGSGIDWLERRLKPIINEAFKDLNPEEIPLGNANENIQFKQSYLNGKVRVEYRYGYKSTLLKNYDGKDGVLSIGWSSGFRYGWTVGSLG